MIKPITLDEQLVKAKDDGGLYRGIFPYDGTSGKPAGRNNGDLHSNRYGWRTIKNSRRRAGA